jgi:hypothetical protein
MLFKEHISSLPNGLHFANSQLFADKEDNQASAQHNYQQTGSGINLASTVQPKPNNILHAES